MGNRNNNDRVLPGRINREDLNRIREAVCIATEKIYDSCRDRDCIMNEQVIFKCPEKVQWLLDKAINVKIRRAVVQDVFTDVEEVPFKRGFFTVDIKFFIRVTLDFFIPCHNGGIKIKTKHGLITFDKKVILFGSEGDVKVFKSHFNANAIDDEMGTELEQDNLPIAQVEVAEPIALNAQIIRLCDVDCCCCKFEQLPTGVVTRFNGLPGVDDDDDNEAVAGLSMRDNDEKAVVVSVGIFSIVKLIRKVQLLIPEFGFCVPTNECIDSTDENPCDLFDTLEFPEDEFFPPQRFDFLGGEEEEEEDHDRC